MIVDFSAHLLPREAVGEILETRGFYGPDRRRFELPYPPQNADPKVRLGLMDKYGIDMELLSQTAPVLLGFGPATAAKICRLSNDAISDMCEKHPSRFAGAAIVSLLDVGTALDELDRTVGGLGFKCVTIATNQKGRGLDSRKFFPFYRKVAKYDVPIFLHPTHWGGYPPVGMKKGWRMMQIFGWPFDTTQAVWRLIFGGVLDEFPSLKLVTHHLGAMFPYFSERVSRNVKSFLQEGLKKPYVDYWSQIYGDTALDGTTAAYPCGFSYFGRERTLFGTDYPFGPEAGEGFMRDNLTGVRAMSIPEEDKRMILGANARKLLKLR
ncbi:MAG TPA: amidohydrolase family protein [Nitrososphaerales archaeon]|nr:amidohydrolase family protein [Nitrososphaerales archaeon]